MKIQTLSLHPYEILLTNGHSRFGALIKIIDEKGNSGWGDIAPLPEWSKETLEECLQQISRMQNEIIKIEWTSSTLLNELAELNLFPAALFGLESALLIILSPLPEFTVNASALLMGSVEEILNQAKLRHREGFTSAKLKVSNLNFEEAAHVIHQLKDIFRLRIDVNRAWRAEDSLHFFSEFPCDTFDYVEEPFQNPKDLVKFTHPLAVDESFPEDLSLEELELLPTLKALIYKPTIQGGMLGSLPLYEWAIKRGFSLVLSSSFESDLGLAHIASIAFRLSLTAPIGIGTYHFLSDYLCATPLRFVDSLAHILSMENLLLAESFFSSFAPRQ